MKTTKVTVMAMALVLAFLSLATTARADGARSYISPSGSDNRPCTRNQPCRSFDGALAKTDAGGEIVAMETGAYDPTTIAKSISGGTIASMGNNMVINNDIDIAGSVNLVTFLPR